MIRVPDIREAKINGLIFKKFQNISIRDLENRWAINSAFANTIGTEHLSSDKKDDVSLAIAYRDELSVLSSDKLEERYQAEQKEIEELRTKLVEERESKLFHQEGMNADYKHWYMADYWTVEECLALSFGKDPRMMSYAYITQHQYYETRMGWNASNFSAQYNSLLDLVTRSVESGSLKTIHVVGAASNIHKQKVIPSNYIHWASTKGFVLPKELIKNASDKTDYKALVDKMTQTISDLEEENKVLKEDLKKQENKRVISTLYKIICGLVKKHYAGNKSGRISMMQKSIFTEAGIDIDDKTLRTHIDEALTYDLSEKEK